MQVPFDFAVKEVSEQLKKIAKGDYQTPDSGKRKFGNIVYAAVTIPPKELKCVLDNVSENLIISNLQLHNSHKKKRRRRREEKRKEKKRCSSSKAWATF